MLTSSALVLLMIPATGLLYSGTSRSSSWSMVWMPNVTAVVVGFVVSSVGSRSLEHLDD
jgi:ammonium transporter, Amt family